jgi:hypothetical protein
MKYLILLLFFISTASYSQKFVNYYDFRDASGTVLTDGVGSANGTLGGAALPVWSGNKYLTFSGGHGTTGGNWSRVDFTRTTYDYNYGSNYTWVIIYRSSKSDAVIHSLIKNRDVNAAATNYITIGIDAAELEVSNIATDVGQSKVSSTSSTICDGKWHIIIVTFGGNVMNNYYDTKLLSNSTNNNITSGNFYVTTNKIVMGASWAQTAGNYQQDYTGDICKFINCNVILTVANVQDIQNEFNIIY